MKNKKILLIVLIVIVLVVIGGVVLLVNKASKTPAGMTEDYIEKYNKLDESVVNKIEYEFDDKLSSSQNDKYIEIIKKQYKEMSYTIKDESINENDASIKVNIQVCDLASTINRANSYIISHSDEFVKDNEFNNSLAIDYKLDELSSCNEKIKYSIDFTYYKKNGKWIMNQLSESDLKKFNGTY